MLLTSTQVSVAISTSVVVTCTFALFFAGYILQQQTVRSLQAMIVQPTIIPQSQYLDLAAASNLESPQKFDLDNLARQKSVEYESKVELERHRLRRGKAFTDNAQSEYGPNGGKRGGYRSNTTPERFRAGRKQADEAARLRADMVTSQDQVDGALDDSDEEEEEEITSTPWIGGKIWNEEGRSNMLAEHEVELK